MSYFFDPDLLCFEAVPELHQASGQSGQTPLEQPETAIGMAYLTRALIYLIKVLFCSRTARL